VKVVGIAFFVRRFTRAGYAARLLTQVATLQKFKGK
jgi:hypothetical protein